MQPHRRLYHQTNEVKPNLTLRTHTLEDRTGMKIDSPVSNIDLTPSRRTGRG